MPYWQKRELEDPTGQAGREQPAKDNLTELPPIQSVVQEESDGQSTSAL